ncbi:VOC family protein [Parasporobacterium paucivorans]|uniref:Lactoylglutathione lyase n=1 Tax=Parasporobacterium paucivorans DSM 15970 TaxID=1122934 RepID=A0A1M6L2L7_9FIRM|nr:VOC family protein [Parasporobacterium paucivorans]SHJ65384.1 lactoylglutathione lyase [Parasporobacterium paucivorans DSM 15970]
MKFCWSTIQVKDMDESLRFYEDIIGLKVNRRFKAGPGIEIVFLGDGETKIELVCDENGKDVNIGTDISWGFEVESVEEKMDFVRAKGISIESGPFQPNPHVKFFYIKDPNGLKIQLVENV